MLVFGDWLSKLSQELDFIWLSDCPGWRSQNLQDDSVKPLDNELFASSDFWSLLSRPLWHWPFSQDDFCLAVFFYSALTPICTLHGNIEDYEAVLFPGNAWIHVDIFRKLILLWYQTVLESTVPRAIRMPSQQPWIMFCVTRPFCFIIPVDCSTWALLGLPCRPENLGLALGNLLQIWTSMQYVSKRPKKKKKPQNPNRVNWFWSF